MRVFFKTWLLLVGLTCLSVSSVFAQWRIQDVDLKAGWNTVHLEVAPQPSECEKIFAGLQVESVWKWNKRFTSTEFNVDPGTMLPDDPHWLVWFPPDHPTAFLTRLYHMSAGGTYLIKMADNASPYILSLRGTPKVNDSEWVPHSLNLIGVSIDPASAPTFSDFFAYTDEVDTSLGFQNEIYQINANGSSTRIVMPARDLMERNRAYWVKCKFVPKSSSVLAIKEGSALEYKNYIDEQSFVLRNESTVDPLNVSIREIASELPPTDGGFPEKAGIVPLAYYAYNAVSNFWYWQNIAENELLTKTLQPLEEWELKFAVRRNNMLPYTPSGTNGYSYQSVLEVKASDPAVLYYMPVSATAVGSSNVTEETSHTDKGLWVGEAKLYRVNCPAYVSDTNDQSEVVFTNTVSGVVLTNIVTTNMMPTDSLCKMRLIIHVDAAGEAKLLQEVFLANVPLDADRNEYRLYANRDHLPADAVDVSRISSVAFPFMAPLPLAGTMTNGMNASFTVDCNDPVNPFMHRYNPMHDNKDWDFATYSNAVETLSVTRDITLSFGENISSNVMASPFWGGDDQGGVYKEILLGLRKQPVVVEGTFSLKRISLIETLNAE
ncbi:MAG: hypothetical protein KAI74_06500 [Kiritimatiellae bacterium]|nr:hypothetical protein [Kiritimatiellia bacterium]